MRKLTKKSLDELAKVIPQISEIEKRTFIGGGTGAKKDPYSIDEFYSLREQNTWNGGWVDGRGYIDAQTTLIYSDASDSNELELKKGNEITPLGSTSAMVCMSIPYSSKSMASNYWNGGGTGDWSGGGSGDGGSGGWSGGVSGDGGSDGWSGGGSGDGGSGGWSGGVSGNWIYGGGSGGWDESPTYFPADYGVGGNGGSGSAGNGWVENPFYYNVDGQWVYGNGILDPSNQGGGGGGGTGGNSSSSGGHSGGGESASGGSGTGGGGASFDKKKDGFDLQNSKFILIHVNNSSVFYQQLFEVLQSNSTIKNILGYFDSGCTALTFSVSDVVAGDSIATSRVISDGSYGIIFGQQYVGKDGWTLDYLKQDNINYDWSQVRNKEEGLVVTLTHEALHVSHYARYQDALRIAKGDDSEAAKWLLKNNYSKEFVEIFFREDFEGGWYKVTDGMADRMHKYMEKYDYGVINRALLEYREEHK